MHVYLFVKQTHIVTDHKTNKYKNNLFASLRTQQEIKSQTYTVRTSTQPFWCYEQIITLKI